jgi:hypothetical protein
VIAVGGAAVAAGAIPALAPRSALAAPTPTSAAETNVKRLYDSLSATQRGTICLPWTDPKRQTVNANWHVTEPTIGSDFYTVEQRKLVEEILRGVSSPDGYDRFVKQMEYDDGGLESYSAAIFGTPGSGKSQFMLTGRHVTIRADGDSVENAAFGGPMVYGHGAELPTDNLFYYQTQRANEVFGALDSKQRAQALIANAPTENEVPLQGQQARFPGIRIGDLSADQQKLMEEVMKVILAPYRTEDVDEVMAILKSGGGLQQLHMAFYQEGDLENDKIWDVWRVEGPTFVWHFRGAPHVHAYVNIGVKA